MRYYIDTEFDEYWSTLISIGVVAQDGREFYAINSNYDWSESTQWLIENVRPHLTFVNSKNVSRYVNGSRSDIADGLLEFLGDDEIEFFGYKSAWDVVLVHKLFGGYERVRQRNDKFPLVCFDIHQIAKSLGIASLKELVAPLEPPHNALSDARWTKFVHEQMILQYGRAL